MKIQLPQAFKKTTAKDMAATTLEDYEIKFFQFQEAAAHNAKLAEFYKEGIERLRAVNSRVN